jgi:tetratricopeptide (TPR) repeat protein
MYDLAKEESPDKVDLAMADIWLRMGDQERAIRSCEARITADSTDANAYAKLGWYYISRKEWVKAVAMYEKVVHFNPRHAPAFVNLSNLYYELGRIDDARQAYQKAYTIDPRYVRSVGRP